MGVRHKKVNWRLRPSSSSSNNLKSKSSNYTSKSRLRGWGRKIRLSRTLKEMRQALLTARSLSCLKFRAKLSTMMINWVKRRAIECRWRLILMLHPGQITSIIAESFIRMSNFLKVASRISWSPQLCTAATRRPCTRKLWPSLLKSTESTTISFQISKTLPRDLQLSPARSQLKTIKKPLKGETKREMIHPIEDANANDLLIFNNLFFLVSL